MDERLKILVVDDQETMRRINAAQLTSLGFNDIRLANDGGEALKLLQGKHFDLVISDWNMPVLSGLDLLLAVRKDAKLAHLPFIMITAEAAHARIEEVIAAGVSDLLIKPYTAKRLQQAIQRARNPRTRHHASATPSAKAGPEPSLTAIATTPEGMSAPITLLLVDDTPDNLHLLAETFKGSYRIRAAQRGQKAVEICCGEDPPDLVLLDVMMPEMDGFEVARKMREHPGAEHIPIIFITALTDTDSRLKGMELGAIDFISKPIDPGQLRLRVDNFIRYVEMRKRLQTEYDNLLEMARLRDDIEAITRHDLKGPLAGAMGILQLLQEDSDTSRRQLGQLRLAEQSILRAMDIVNLSTELFKIETGRFVLDAKPLPIGDILRRITETARATFASKHLVIAVDADMAASASPPMALGDITLTYSMLHNLVRNACEASAEHGRISIELLDRTPLQIRISNPGVIPMEIRDRFFGKYVTQGKKSGTGLGAYSAKLLATAQKGDISFVVSDAEQQTTLTVTLPRHHG